METRVEGAMEEVQDRLKQLQKTPRGQVRLTLTCLVKEVFAHIFHSLFICIASPVDLSTAQSMMEPAIHTLKPIAMSRQVSAHVTAEPHLLCLSLSLSLSLFHDLLYEGMLWLSRFILPPPLLLPLPLLPVTGEWYVLLHRQ